MTLSIMVRRRRRASYRRRRRHYQRGGILPFLIPLAIAGGKALPAGAVSGVAGWGVKKGLDAASRKKRVGKISAAQAAANQCVVRNMHRRWFNVAGVFYDDFTSLYPWVNKKCKYPVGHPVIHTQFHCQTPRNGNDSCVINRTAWSNAASCRLITCFIPCCLSVWPASCCFPCAFNAPETKYPCPLVETLLRL